ncbi:Phosphoribulokinase/uridine kinase [Niveomyces insectorum RCEF 264]|uniref:Phosphoribulokinase/uridine kinase n=1 Tax=Niveomyces insectorum RCEF 264 TaxID=1081102 RepID=A0A167SLZ7_9HYPO|nr:Phosphoribulokinase/uridine kinase [Niveomyces insectorum RCEF 264]
MEPIVNTLVARAEALQSVIEQNRASGSAQSRAVIALAGPPGSGKSTIAKMVVDRLNVGRPVPAALVLPMDGFHYSRAVLNAMPNADEAHARRGAAWTFDADGLVALLRCLKESGQRPLPEIHDIVAPSFDHSIKDPVADDIVIGRHITMVIVEGLWLLYDEEPWRQIRDLVDESWYIDVDSDAARERIARRHISSGIETSWDAALARADGNDILNGIAVREKLLSPDIKVFSVDDIVVGTPTAEHAPAEIS